MILTQTGRQGSNPLHNQDIHPTDLSPLSSGSGSSVRSDSQTSSPSPTNSSKESNMIGTQLLQALNNGRSGQHFQTNDLSPLQRLQFAFERTSILSNLFPAKEGRVPLDDHQSTPLSSPHFREGQGVMSLSSPSQVETDEARQNEQIPLGSPNSDPANIFQCPLCALPCNGRHSFNEHLVTHTTQNACPKCDYLTSSEEMLRDHLLQEHDMDDPTQAVMEEDASVPKLNAQGKVKTFKCKQCGHLSLTKAESWTHSASHIRPEKMLKCPKCTFVTEYKHHLEYHLRLHVGSKPYQCNVCPYTCVNKSMLNSHLKSHSAVYQYNCMDCDYQTKYCHSLKMHLRKLNHKPSMVLNPDGTPNPLPIIDVYGTRRGPKMKKSQPNAAVAKPETYPKIPQTHFQNQPASYLHSPANSSSNHSSFSSHGSRDSLDQISPQINPLEEAPKPKGRKPKNGPPYPLKRSLASGESSSSDGDHIRIQRHTDGDAGTKAIDGFEPASEQLFNKSVQEIRSVYAAALNQYLLSNPLVFGPGGPEHLARVAREQERRMAEQLQVQNGLQFHNQPVRMHEINGQRVVPPPGGPIQNSVALDLRHPKSESERRRRKGKAHRYERHAYEDDVEESEGEMALDFSNNNNYKSQAQKHYKMDEEREEVNGGSLMCKYCEISFPDQVLYRMHMSYHSGETDPFVCKSCGKRTQDKVSFFLHLTTDSH